MYAIVMKVVSPPRNSLRTRGLIFFETEVAFDQTGSFPVFEWKRHSKQKSAQSCDENM